jgi:penicillin-binding protein 1A
VIARVNGSSGALLYEAPGADGELPRGSLALLQEGLRGVVRLPGGTAHALSGTGFPIPVMGKTGTTSDFRDALFVGSTYGAQGITVAVRIGFDDNRTLGPRETGGRTAMPVFREIVARVYADALVGTVPQFPREMEDRIDAYLAAPSGPALPGPIAVYRPDRIEHHRPTPVEAAAIPAGSGVATIANTGAERVVVSKEEVNP